MRSFWCRLFIVLTASLVGGCCAGEIGGEWLWAPNYEKKPFDQQVVSEVACGPTSALNTLRYSKISWSKLLREYEQSSDEETLRNVIFNVASLPSRDGSKIPLWSEKNLMTADHYVEMLTVLQGKGFWKKRVKRYLLESENAERSSLLEQVEERVRHSLEKEVAPTLELALFVRPELSDLKIGHWVRLEGHLVVVLGLKKEAHSLTMLVADSDGGRKYEIHLREEVSASDLAKPVLVVEAEGFRLWKKQKAQYPKHCLTITGVIGR